MSIGIGCNRISICRAFRDAEQRLRVMFIHDARRPCRHRRPERMSAPSVSLSARAVMLSAIVSRPPWLY
jgi:hypothetical protein